MTPRKRDWRLGVMLALAIGVTGVAFVVCAGFVLATIAWFLVRVGQ